MFNLRFICLTLITFAATVVLANDADMIFLIGKPDARAAEFGLVKEGYAAYAERFPNDVDYTVGKSTDRDWSFVHPAQMDTWANGEKTHPFTIHFKLDNKPSASLYLLIGNVGTLPDKESDIVVTVNGNKLPSQLVKTNVNNELVFTPRNSAKSVTQILELPAENFVIGDNTIVITLDKKSWILYDYVALRTKNEPLAIVAPPAPDLLKAMRAGVMAGVDKVVFTVRRDGVDGHWYANFGYYADDTDRLPHRTGGKLCVLDLNTKEITTLIDEPDGSVRDPQIHYDGNKMLVSWRPSGTKFFHLWEMNIDGSDKRQLTFDEFDDIEPTYLPDGGIVFVSTRTKRWVQCWLTQVATLHRCDADGKNIREISANMEQDNTPWVLPNGQLLYTRWEYVDRSQVHFHHLWIMNPDGTRQTVFYGNLNPGTTMIDAKPVPNSAKIVASFSPGHGRKEHAGVITLVDPRLGPDDHKAAKQISRSSDYRDPWAFSETAFMAAIGSQIRLLNDEGDEQTICSIPEDWRKAGFVVNEPRPVLQRAREFVIQDQTNQIDRSEPGKLTVIDVHRGRNMEGVNAGTIKKLLIMESLPKPINFTGGMEPLSYGGTFTLERIYGVVPVEEDGSASFVLPPLRSFFFIALDENNLAVKRMQSFTSVMPGESTTCIGCHENRTNTPIRDNVTMAMAPRRQPNVPQRFNDLPDVIDFPRDVQPVLNRHCVDCHNADKPEGMVVLTGERGPVYSMSYYTLTVRDMLADGRNLPKSNYPPYTLGSGGSKLLKMIREHHADVKMPESDERIVRLWLEMGAPYPGTYAALGSGMIGGYAENNLDRRDLGWNEVKAAQEVLQTRCASCHVKQKNNVLPQSPTDEIGGPPWDALRQNDIRRRYSRHLLYNLTNPDKSRQLLAPLAKSAGGYELCGKAVFESKDDVGYKTLLTAIERTKTELDTIKRFDMPGFVPRQQYIREMKRYGILPPEYDAAKPIDTYSLEQKYWESLWQR
ncbi:MAG: hypothetical protein LBU65_09670 [Planctomycetaceae bacterium]|jgi:cytochrome c553|nr:hypothetical protein [Planctomycetaceae bacterium]